jgi:hypothetical protein
MAPSMTKPVSKRSSRPRYTRTTSSHTQRASQGRSLMRSMGKPNVTQAIAALRRQGLS